MQSVLTSLPNKGFFIFPEQPPLFLAQGSHTLRYLQARTTQDFRTLAPGESRQAACLDSQGKTQALITVQCLQPQQEYLIIGDGGDSKAVAQAILQFRVTEQIALEPIPAETTVHIFGVSGEQLESLKEQFGITYAIPSMRTLYPGWDLPLTGQNSESMLSLLHEHYEEISEESWRAMRITARRFHFPDEIQPGKTFLESGLTSAYAIGKGCYPGQEVVERVLSRGKSPSLLLPYYVKSALVEKDAPVFEVSKSTDLEQRRSLGHIISIGAVPSQGGYCVAVRIRNTQETPPDTLYLADGTPLELILS